MGYIGGGAQGRRQEFFRFQILSVSHLCQRSRCIPMLIFKIVRPLLGGKQISNSERFLASEQRNNSVSFAL
jgi:hypothetical protein